MECQHCKKILSSVSALNYHRKNTKSCLQIQGKIYDTKIKCEYCSKTLSSKSSQKRHMVVCTHKYKYIEEQLYDAKKEIEMLKNTIAELRQDKKELQERYADLSITAVKRPVNNTRNIQINNFIQKMEPLKIEDIKETVPMLTLDHHVKGPEGYAEYALEFPFKNKIVCVDVNRNKIKYKDGEGNVIEDLGFQKMMTKLCESLKDRSFSLSQEHYEKLSEEFTEEELNEYNCMNTALAISRYANGRDSEFCNKLIKLISKGSAIK
jgi:hypothetical protein